MSRIVWSRVFQRETLSLFDDDGFDPFEDHGKLRGADEGDRLSVSDERNGNPEATRFQAFVPLDIAVLVPIKDFESVGRLVDEDEERAVERILLKAVFDDGGESVERLSHVDGSCRDVNRPWETVQHEPTSSWRIRAANVSDGVSTGNRSVKPFFVTSSILASVDVESSSST